LLLQLLDGTNYIAATEQSVTFIGGIMPNPKICEVFTLRFIR